MTKKTLGEEGTLNAYTIAPDEIKGGDRYGYKIVAVVSEYHHGWCAYEGPTDWTDKKVADNGDEVPEGAAKALFPTLAATCGIYGDW